MFFWSSTREKSVFWIHYVQLGADMNFLFFLTEMKLPYPIFTLPDFEWPNQKKEYILWCRCGKNSPSSVHKRYFTATALCMIDRIDRPSQKSTPEVDNLMKSSFLWCFGGHASKVIRYWELARFLVLIFYSYVGSDFYVSTSNIRLLTWCIENNNLG